MKKISIVMRSRNDAAYAPLTIEAFLSQKRDDFEILSFDNASADGTAEIIARYPQIRKFHVPEGAYVPGKVLNAAVKEAVGEIVVFNNADAVPQGTNWLSTLVAPIESRKAQASYGRQICRPDADLWVRADYAKGFPQNPQDALSGFFSMASSAALKSVFESAPFSETIKYSEDVHWARRLEKLGFKIAYAAGAESEHSHNYTLEQIKKRFAGEGIADAEIYGRAQSFARFAKGLAGAILRDALPALKAGGLKEFMRNLKIRYIQKKSYYDARGKAAAK